MEMIARLACKRECVCSVLCVRECLLYSTSMCFENELVGSVCWCECVCACAPALELATRSVRATGNYWSG